MRGTTEKTKTMVNSNIANNKRLIKGGHLQKRGYQKATFHKQNEGKERARQRTARTLSFCQPVTLCHPNRLRIAYFDPKGRPMKKNKTLKMFLSHSQKDSEIFTNNLEEKQEKMPPSQEEKARKRRFQSPKAGKTLLFPSENNAFVEEKHTT